MDNEELRRLVKNALAASGPDLRLDAEVWDATEPDGRKLEFDEAGNGFKRVIVRGVDTGSRDPAPCLTASVDLALGLHERLNGERGWRLILVQGWPYKAGERTASRWHAQTMIKSGRSGDHPQNDAVEAATPALAVLAAALRAAARAC